MFQIGKYEEGVPQPYIITKNSLPDLSMPNDFTEFDKKLISRLPKYVKQGLRLAKRKLDQYLKRNANSVQKTLIDSYFLKTSLLNIVYKKRHTPFPKTISI